MKVAILGASPKKDRYSNKAQSLLKEKGHEVLPVNPAYNEIDGEKVYPHLSDIHDAVDTLTVYVGDIAPFMPEVLKLKPRRVIFNPGTESPGLYDQLHAAGIVTEEACTLVLLRTGQF